MADKVCGKCQGSTWILGDDGEVTPCDCRERTLKRARASGLYTHIPKRFDGVRFDSKTNSFLDRERPLDIPGAITRQIRRYVRGRLRNREDFSGDVRLQEGD
jgi:hypothetical protein